MFLGVQLFETIQQLHLAAFSTLTLLVERQEGHSGLQKGKWWDAGVIMYLAQGADLPMVQLMPLPHTISRSSKSRLSKVHTYTMPR